MLIILTLGVMLAVAYVYTQEGLFTAATMFVNVLLAGVITFNFFEPAAGALGRLFTRSFLKNYEDVIALTALFTVSLGVLRGVTNRLAPEIVEYPGPVQQGGGLVFGLLTGYLVSGFLICALQTLPWHPNFFDFEPRSKDEAPMRRVFPPDRVWLALMHHAGLHGFGRGESPDAAAEASPPTFDRYGAFETNYLWLRRHPNK